MEGDVGMMRRSLENTGLFCEARSAIQKGKKSGTGCVSWI